MVNLSIDGGSPMTMDNFGKHYTLNSEAPLYVGGEDLPYILLQASSPSCGDSVPRQGQPVLCGQRLTRRADARAREMLKDEMVTLVDSAALAGVLLHSGQPRLTKKDAQQD